MKNSITVLVLFFLLYGCAGFPDTGLNKQFNYDSIYTIGIYIHPSDFSSYDQELFNITRLKFSSLGYDIRTLSPEWTKKMRDTVSFRGHAETAQFLFDHDGKGCDAIVILNPSWSFALRTVEISIDELGIVVLTKLSLEMTMFSKNNSVPLLSRYVTRFEDIYKDKKKGIRLRGAPTHVLFQRVVGDILAEFPVCKQENLTPAKYTIPIVFFVDSAYLRDYQHTWDLRLEQRMLFVNDVYKRYFNTHFKIVDYRAWKPANDTDAEASLKDLVNSTQTAKGIIIAGMMVNSDVINKWRESNEPWGIAEIFGKCFIASDLIYLPGMEQWNAIDESAVIIHELGHVFGASHTYDINSTMYPSASIISFEFDSLNAEIIKRRITNFATVDRKTAFSQYIDQMLHAYTKGLSPKTKYVSQVFYSLQQLKNMNSDTITQKDSVQIEDIMLCTRDSAFQQALLGRYFFVKKQWGKSEEYFLKSIEWNPELIESYFLLSSAYDEMGKKRESEEYAKLGREKLYPGEEDE